MIESFTNQLSGRQQNARRIGRQCVKFRDQCCALPLGFPSVQDKQQCNLSIQYGLNGIEMLGALGQHQQLATLAISSDDFGSNRVRSGLAMARCRNTS